MIIFDDMGSTNADTIIYYALLFVAAFVGGYIGGYILGNHKKI